MSPTKAEIDPRLVVDIVDAGDAQMWVGHLVCGVRNRTMKEPIGIIIDGGTSHLLVADSPSDYPDQVGKIFVLVDNGKSDVLSAYYDSEADQLHVNWGKLAGKKVYPRVLSLNLEDDCFEDSGIRVSLIGEMFLNRIGREVFPTLKEKLERVTNQE